MQALTVLVLGHVWPEPQSSAAGLHMLSFLRLFLQQNWQVIFATEAKAGEWAFDLSSLGIHCHTIQMNDSSQGDWFASVNPDIVLFDRFLTEEQYGWLIDEHCPNALKILDTEDLHALRYSRQQWVKQHQQVVPTAFDGLDFNHEHLYRELAAIFRCDLTLIIADYEMDLLRDYFNIPASLLHYCPFLIPPERIQPSVMDFHARQDCLLIGNFFHAPNWDAALWLCQQLWPQIRQHLPELNLRLCGAYPSHKVWQLHQPKLGIFVEGHIDDVQDMMARCRVNLAPLRFGAGLKGKIIEAMLAGLPTVTTAVAMQGISPAPFVPTTDVDECFVQQLVRLYTEPDYWQKAQQDGYETLKTRFNFEQHSQSLMQRIQHVLLDLAGHRRRNVMGNMLKHHQFRSTKYMAKWIELKNQSSAD